MMVYIAIDPPLFFFFFYGPRQELGYLHSHYAATKLHLSSRKELLIQTLPLTSSSPLLSIIAIHQHQNPPETH